MINLQNGRFAPYTSSTARGPPSALTPGFFHRHSARNNRVSAVESHRKRYNISFSRLPPPLGKANISPIKCEQGDLPKYPSLVRGSSGGAMGAPRSGRSDLSEWQRSAEGEEACRRRQMLGTATGPSTPTNYLLFYANKYVLRNFVRSSEGRRGRRPLQEKSPLLESFCGAFFKKRQKEKRLPRRKAFLYKPLFSEQGYFTEIGSGVFA